LNPIEQKAALRADIQRRVREMTAEERQEYSDEICERVLEMSQWAEAQSVVLFSPLPSEPIITPLKLDCEARKISLVNIPQSMRSESDLHFPDAVDLVLVPGIAFSKERHRLGRGGGFFDRLLVGRAANAFKLGVCFSFQMLDNIPMEEHDMVMDAVVTNEGQSGSVIRAVGA
jgi:5-formyltetrahydrofolate cyclo-ligase